MDPSRPILLLLTTFVALAVTQSLSDTQTDDENKSAQILLYQLSQDVADIKSMIKSLSEVSKPPSSLVNENIRNNKNMVEEDARQKLYREMKRLLILKRMSSIASRTTEKRNPPAGFYAVRGKRAVSA